MGIIENLLKDKNKIESELSKIQKQKVELEHKIRIIQVEYGQKVAVYEERCQEWLVNKPGWNRFFKFYILFPSDRLKRMTLEEQQKVLGYFKLGGLIELFNKSMDKPESPPEMCDSDKKEIGKLQKQLAELEK